MVNPCLGGGPVRSIKQNESEVNNGKAEGESSKIESPLPLPVYHSLPTKHPPDVSSVTEANLVTRTYRSPALSPSGPARTSPEVRTLRQPALTRERVALVNAHE